MPTDSIITLGIALVLLTGGAEVLVRGSIALAQRMGVSSFFIGLTIVGFGTSTPELAASVTAAIRGHSDINVGNVVGSNICNIALILGATALFAPIVVHRQIIRVELWILLAVSLVPFAALLTGGVITRWLSAAMLGMLTLIVWRGYIVGRAEQPRDLSGLDEFVRSMPEPTPRAWREHVIVHIALIVIGLAILIGGSHLLVSSAVSIARHMELSELVIGLTIVALGTSSPELVTSILAAIRRQTDLSVGNLFGSNIFNVLGILSASAMIAPPVIAPQTLQFDLPVMLLVTLACLPMMLSGRRIARGEGATLIAIYIGYILILLTLAPRWFG